MIGGAQVLQWEKQLLCTQHSVPKASVTDQIWLGRGGKASGVLFGVEQQRLSRGCFLTCESDLSGSTHKHQCAFPESEISRIVADCPGIQLRTVTGMFVLVSPFSWFYR